MFKVNRSNRSKMEMWQIFHLCSEKHLKTSSDRQVDTSFRKSGVAESNGAVRILTGSSEVAVSAHAQYKFGQNSPEPLARCQAALSSCSASPFLVIKATPTIVEEALTSPKNPERLAQCHSAFEMQCFCNCTLSSLRAALAPERLDL